MSITTYWESNSIIVLFFNSLHEEIHPEMEQLNFNGKVLRLYVSISEVVNQLDVSYKPGKKDIQIPSNTSTCAEERTSVYEEM